jgi:NAD(P)-dependent dehydrogenase (short-subunit alcohol dehydrogenase family)
LRPEKSLAALDRDSLSRVFALNAFAPVLLAKALLPLLGPGAPRVFASLSARVGSIGDNRLGGWYAYRASKAAQNQLLHTLAIEWRRTHPHATCVVLHPGTVDTPLSRPFQANLAADALFTPDAAARRLLGIIAGVTPADSGRFIAWDGSQVPW